MTPAHLPVRNEGSRQFAQLYRRMGTALPALVNATDERLIRCSFAVGDVYRQLPSADDRELTGYVTATRIRFAPGRTVDCDMFSDRPCVFHSHPTAAPAADQPSLQDVYCFLRFPVRRFIAVGREWIWWWDKSPQLLKPVGRLLAWEATALIPTMLRIVAAQPATRVASQIAAVALGPFGVTPDSLGGEIGRWSQALKDAIGLETRRCPRTSGGAA